MHLIEISVLYSDTTYDILIGKTKVGRIVAVVADYVSMEINIISKNVIKVPDKFIIDLPQTVEDTNYAHMIPLIKNAPVIHDILENQDSEILYIISSPCYNVYHLLKRLFPTINMQWAQFVNDIKKIKTKNKSYKTKVIDLFSQEAFTPREIMQAAEAIISHFNTFHTSIEYIDMKSPYFIESLRTSPTNTRFFKICVHDAITT